MRMVVPEGTVSRVRRGRGGVFPLPKPDEKEQTVQRRWESPHVARFADCGIFRKEKRDEEKLQRRAEERKEEEEKKIQRQADGQPNVAPSVSADIQSSLASGAPLPLSVRRFMEPRFRADFSQVRIHTGDQPARLNRQLNARAFALGNHIFFGRDRAGARCS